MDTYPGCSGDDSLSGSSKVTATVVSDGADDDFEITINGDDGRGCKKEKTFIFSGNGGRRAKRF